MNESILLSNNKLMWLLLLGITIAIYVPFAISIKREQSGPHQIIDNTSQIKSRINVPINYKKIRLVKFDHQVGTTDKPTIDGGIINATDNSHAIKDEITPVKSLPESEVTSESKSSKNDVAFNDSWATSKKVKYLLREAATDGKLQLVLQKINKSAIPESVAIVPMIESNYQSRAISPKGAVGTWQLMNSVAQDYGMNPVDRLDLSLSTDVALKLLQKLYQQFGNWELALAAYNAGGRRVECALLKNPKAKTIDELELPHETKRFVKKIHGVSEVLIQASKDDV